MTDFFDYLLLRGWGRLPTVRPRLLSRFEATSAVDAEPSPALISDPVVAEPATSASVEERPLAPQTLPRGSSQAPRPRPAERAKPLTAYPTGPAEDGDASTTALPSDGAPVPLQQTALAEHEARETAATATPPSSSSEVAVAPTSRAPERTVAVRDPMAAAKPGAVASSRAAASPAMTGAAESSPLESPLDIPEAAADRGATHAEQRVTPAALATSVELPSAVGVTPSSWPVAKAALPSHETRAAAASSSTTFDRAPAAVSGAASAGSALPSFPTEPAGAKRPPAANVAGAVSAPAPAHLARAGGVLANAAHVQDADEAPPTVRFVAEDASRLRAATARPSSVVGRSAALSQLSDSGEQPQSPSEPRQQPELRQPPLADQSRALLVHAERASNESSRSSVETTPALATELPAAPRASASAVSPASEGAVRISIGSIEVRAVVPQPRPQPSLPVLAPQPQAPAPALSLDQYLAERDRRRA